MEYHPLFIASKDVQINRDCDACVSDACLRELIDKIASEKER